LSHPLQPNYFKSRLLGEREEFTSAELVQPNRAQISAVPTALTGALERISANTDFGYSRWLDKSEVALRNL
jgi:hypothetical protein